jgi:hypothetical protein
LSLEIAQVPIASVGDITIGSGRGGFTEEEKALTSKGIISLISYLTVEYGFEIRYHISL